MMRNANDNARVILGMALHGDDDFAWDQLKVLQGNMYAAGPVAIRFAYYGAEGALQSRPLMTSRWIGNADDMAEMLDRARAGCVCGCYVDIGDILAEALKEPVKAVVIIGDAFHGSKDEALARARQLRDAGTRLFFLQQGRHHSDEIFRELAALTGGAYFSFEPAVERIAERLPDTLEAITHFAIGGTPALEARAEDSEAAVLLLEQMQNAPALE